MMKPLVDTILHMDNLFRLLDFLHLIYYDKFLKLLKQTVNRKNPLKVNQVRNPLRFLKYLKGITRYILNWLRFNCNRGVTIKITFCFSLLLHCINECNCSIKYQYLVPIYQLNTSDIPATQCTKIFEKQILIYY